MTPLLQMVLLNTAVVAPLAVGLFLLQRLRAVRHRPELSYALWLLLMLKLVTPPVITVDLAAPSPPVQILNLLPSGNDSSDASTRRPHLAPHTEAVPASHDHILAMQGADLIWLGVAAILLCTILRQQRRLKNLLASTLQPPAWLEELSRQACRGLTLHRVPVIRLVEEQLSAFLCRGKGGLFIVLPRALLKKLDRSQLQLVIRHELAHASRGDHWANLALSLACVVLWWHPLAWWIRRHARARQEEACDRLALANGGDRARYAGALLATIDMIRDSDDSVYVPATAMSDGRSFTRRIDMIVNNTQAVRASRMMRAVICGCAAVLLPLGFSLAADVEAVGKRLRTAVAEGELTAEQARHMLATLKKTESQQSADQVPTAERFESWVRETGEKLRAAVETGKATEKEAWAKWATFKEKKAAPKLKAMVEDGVLTAEAAGKLMQKIATGELRQRLEAAVARGDLTEEEAKAKWEALPKTDDGLIKPKGHEKHSPKGDVRANGKSEFDWTVFKKRLAAGVTSGVLTKEEAEQKLLDMQRRLDGKKDTGE